MQESLRRRTALDVDVMHQQSFVFGLETVLIGLETRLKSGGTALGPG